MKLKRNRSFHFQKSWLAGVLTAILFTLGAVLVFALILSLMDVPSPVIRVVNQGIKLGAILTGIKFSVEKGDSQGVFRGALIGFVYMAAGLLVYALFTRQELPFSSYLMDIFLGISAGGLYGLLRKRQSLGKCDKAVA